MSTFYLDFEGGSDAADGTTFANRWKSLTAGPTAARIAPGDTIRVMASPAETSMGQNATWTKASQTVTLASAVTTTVDLCETAWTASANITTSTTTNSCEGTNSAGNAFATAFTTGLASFKATGTLDLSGYQQVSFWLYTTVAIGASTLSLRLCSDVAGVTTVDTITIPQITPTSVWIPITVDKGSALGASIQSIALYADIDPGVPTVYLDNIIACKASSAADSLNLKSLIGKVHTQPWIASTAFATNDIRRPTETNRTGFAYKVTAGGGGSSAASEPTWPQDPGLTVTDGALTWTCQQLEEYWHAILSISGTTVKVNRDLSSSNAKGSAKGYAGATETVAIYKREYTDIDISLGTTTAQIVQDTGSEAGGQITFSGGWDRTAMTTRNRQTWLGMLSRRAYSATLWSCGNQEFITLDGINCVNGAINTSPRCIIKNCHILSAQNGFAAGISHYGCDFNNCGLVGGSGSLFANNLGGMHGVANCMTANSNYNAGITLYSGSTNNQVTEIRFTNVDAKQNYSYGVYVSGPGADTFFYRLNTEGPGTGVYVGSYEKAIRLFKSTLADTTPYGGVGSGTNGSLTSGLYSQDDGGVAGTHVIYKILGTISSATDQRHTASGIAWKFKCQSSIYTGPSFPLEMSVAKFAVATSALVTVTIWVRRDATNIKGRLRLKPGLIAGAATGTYVDCNPSINTWTQYTLTFTPSEAGVVDLHYQTWNTINITEFMWIDDIGISQA